MRIRNDEIDEGFVLLRLKDPREREAIQRLRGIHKPEPSRPQESITAAHTRHDTIEVPHAELE